MMDGLLCQLCRERGAVSHFTECAIDGSVTSLHACATCLDLLDLDLAREPLPIAEIIGLYQAHNTDGSDPDEQRSLASEEQPRCPDCGLSLEEFHQQNRFGCASDYAAFADRLAPMLQRLHGSERHRGRLPLSPEDADRRQQAEREALERELQQAVRREDYEQAAVLRDRIQSMLERDEA